jgi:hypothetical protein
LLAGHQRRFILGKFCIIAETAVNKGLGMLQMSVATFRYEIWLCAGIDGRPRPLPYDRELIGNGEARHHVADLFTVDRVTLYLALAATG